MLIYGQSLSLYCGSWLRVGNQSESNDRLRCKKLSGSGRRSITCKFQSVRLSRACSVALTTLLTTAAVIACVAAADEIERPETLSNIPQTLSGECTLPKDCKKARIQKPKSREAESCTIKCVTTCIRGGEGSPGEGPFNVIRPLVVFKQGFRTRQYCSYIFKTGRFAAYRICKCPEDRDILSVLHVSSGLDEPSKVWWNVQISVI